MSPASLQRNFRVDTASKSTAATARKLRGVAMSKIELSAREYATGVAAALRADYSSTPSMVKAIGDDTGASVGAIKNWLAEVNGPTGEYLIKLMGTSKSVRAFVDQVTGRDDLAAQDGAKLRRLLAIMEGREDPPAVVELVPALEADLEQQNQRRPAAQSFNPRDHQQIGQRSRQGGR